MANIGLLSTPNLPILNSLHPKDDIKPSYFPLPYQTIHIIESLKIQSPPTWHINVGKDTINFKIKWDVTDNSNSNSSVNNFAKAVIQALSVCNTHDPVWNTSYNNKKTCLKV